MSPLLSKHAPLTLGTLALAMLAGAAGYGVALMRHDGLPKTQPSEAENKILYWYDPMVPSQHFDKPGKSPFMDMQLVPRYAENAAAQAGMAIDPARIQNLGVRIAIAQMGTLGSSLTVAGSIDFNQRDVAVVQARAPAFVTRVYARAPGDVIAAGAPLADLLIPEWAGAQTEFLAVRRTGDAALIGAARQRLALLGMPGGTLAAVERSGRPHNTITLTAPIGGMIKTLGVRAGMTLSTDETLAEISGLGTVWLNAALPEAMAGQVHVGQAASATLTAWPGERFAGTVSAILPGVNTDSRTLTLRIALPNQGNRLKPGMFASVAFAGSNRAALLVPSQAVIRTGTRSLVMLALDGGRYQPAEVSTGAERQGQTEILAGLAEGEKVVASGQFLIDSEASLSGVPARPLTTPKPAQQTQAGAYATSGHIDHIGKDSVTLSHQAVPALQWPAMTMSFSLADPSVVRGFKVGDQVRFSFDQTPSGPVIRTLSSEKSQ